MSTEMSDQNIRTDMEPGQAFDSVTRPDPTRSLSVVKQILDNGLVAVSVTCHETQTV